MGVSAIAATGGCSGIDRSDVRFTALDQAIERYRDRSDGVSYVLERAKFLFGALPIPVLHYVADAMGLPHGDLYQAASFYDLFATRPEGMHTIAVCLGTRCYQAGARELFNRLQATLQIGPGETTPDGLFTLTVTYSGDPCGDRPAIWIDDQQVSIGAEEIEALLDSYRPVPVGAE